jgi:hypothetical protein
VSKHRRSTRPAAVMRLAIVGVCASVAAGAWLLAPGSPRTQPGPTASISAARPPRPATAVLPVLGARRVGPKPVPRAGRPARLRIPTIDVDVALEPLALRPDGRLNTPPHWDVPGWYSGGPRPGDPGPAVIAGHVDSRSGPAVFFHLSRLRIGDLVYVVDRGGSRLRFVVDDVEAFPKNRFPGAFVYGPQPVPVLRLITCTGMFDAAQRSYLDNLVVSAHLA